MTRRRPSPAGLFLALLALAVQLVLGTAAWPSRATAGPAAFGPRSDRALLATLLQGGLPGAGILCHTDGGAPDRGPAQAPVSPDQPYHGDCAICPLCVAAAQPAALPVASLLPPPPAVLAVPPTAPTPPAAPQPRIARTSAQPRAPPALT